MHELENTLRAASLFADGKCCAADLEGLIDRASEEGLESPAPNPEK
ncbi:MAG: hypothetical protein NZM37_05010 [Sandaracinaceae bacterium]|nr:hypothetical protein [Sandaracinaceae bacterium]